MDMYLSLHAVARIEADPERRMDNGVLLRNLRIVSHDGATLHLTLTTGIKGGLALPGTQSAPSAVDAIHDAVAAFAPAVPR